MREQIILFIYRKGDELFFIYEQDAKDDNDRLLQEGYKHVDTINAIEWIEHNYNKRGGFCQCEKPKYSYLNPVCFECNKVVQL